jgi:hypothetical protein
MPLPPLADLAALGTRLGMELVDAHGDPTEPEGVRAQAALEDASALVRTEAGKSFTDEAHAVLDAGIPDIIVSIVLAAAYRAFRNPEGTSQSSIGDVSVSFAREGSAGAVFLTKAEQRAIRKAAGRNTFGTIVMASPYMVNVTDVNHLVPGSDPGSDPVPLGPFPWEG